jgi:hypothetical protein
MAIWIPKEREWKGTERKLQNSKMDNYAVQIRPFIFVSGERSFDRGGGKLGRRVLDESSHGVGGDLERRTEVECSGVTPVDGERRLGGVAPAYLSG